MALITWSDSFSVKVKIFDEHHKKLADLVNMLHDAMKKGESKQIQERLLEELVSYTVVHFSEEEKYFELYKYPDLMQHKREHKILTDKVTEYSNSIKFGRSIISIELMNFLKDWLLNHIANSDKKYSDYFASKGVE